MPDPTTLPAAPFSGNGATFTIRSKDDAIQQRTLQVIVSMKALYPSRFSFADLWRSVQFVTQPVSSYWFRLAEGVEIALTEKNEKWYDEKMGLTFKKAIKAVIPTGAPMQADDEVIVTGKKLGFLVGDVIMQSGVTSLTLDAVQSKFRQPSQGQGTLRMMTIGALVG